MSEVNDAGPFTFSYILRAEVLSLEAVRGQATQELVVTGVGGR